MKVLFLVIALSIFTVASAVNSKKREADAAEKKLCEGQGEAYLQEMNEGEKLKAFSVLDLRNRYFCAVTNQRIVFDTSSGRVSLPYTQIKKVKYETANGSRARIARDVFQIVINADKKYTLSRKSVHFSEIPAALTQYC